MLLFLLANLTGVIGGAFVVVMLQPERDFYWLLPAFMLLGVIVANLVLALLLQLSRASNPKTVQK